MVPANPKVQVNANFTLLPAVASEQKSKSFNSSAGGSARTLTPPWRLAHDYAVEKDWRINNPRARHLAWPVVVDRLLPFFDRCLRAVGQLLPFVDRCVRVAGQFVGFADR